MKYIKTLEDLKNALEENCDSGTDILPTAEHFSQIQKAIKRILIGIKNKEIILVAGDYDVDGIVATTIMVDYFRNVLKYPVEFIIPDRFKNGYGLKTDLIKNIKCDLIITVDNGITANEAADFCKANNIDLIITDHHTPKDDLPDAYAIIDQKVEGETYPFEGICGAQISWLICEYINRNLKVNYDMTRYYDILGIAVVADVMPLTNINKKIVRESLEKLNNSEYPVLRLIKDSNKYSQIVTSEDLGFRYAPLINAVGRLENANRLVLSLLTKDEDLAKETYEFMDSTNTRRKEIQNEMVEASERLIDSSKSGIVVLSEDWHEGVVGIVAGMLAQQFIKPAIVLTYHNGVYKGSGRSIGNVNLFIILSNIADKHPDVFLGFGGHKEACGMAIKEENAELFANAFEKELEMYSPDDYFLEEELIGEINPELINLKTLELIDSYQPFGFRNPMPKFLARDIELRDVKFLSDDTHLKITFEAEQNVLIDGLLWNFKKVVRERFDIKKGNKYNFSFKIGKNEFRGKITTQVTLDNLNLE